MSKATEQSQKYRTLLIITTIVNIIVQLKGFIIIKLITNYFSKEQFAEFAFTLNTGVLLSAIAVGGVLISLNRYLAEISEKKEKNKIDLIISTSIVVILFLLIITTVSYFLVNFFFNLVEFSNMGIIFLLSGIYAFLYSFYSIFYRYSLIYKKAKKYLLYSLAFESFGFVGLLIGLLIFKSIIMIFVFILIGQFISFVFIIIEWKFRLIPRKINVDYSKKILRFGIPKQISETSNRIFYYILSIFVLYNLSEIDFAELAIASSIASLVIFILANITVNYQPHIATLVSLNTEETKILVKKDIDNTIKTFIFLGLGGIILITSMAKYLILLISTAEYMNALFLIYFLIIAQSLFFFTRIIGIGIFIKEKTMMELIISIISMLIGLLVGFFLGKYFGMYGYLASFLIFVVLRFIVIIIISNKHLRISIDFRFLIKISGIIMVIISEYIIVFKYGLSNYLVLFVIPTYLLLTYLLKTVNYKSLINQLKILFSQMTSLVNNKGFLQKRKKS